MFDLIHDEARDVFAPIANFATIITSEAIASRAKWPFVSVPHFEVRGLELNSLSNMLMVGFSPLVQESDRERWEIYANYMQKWIAEGIEYNTELHQNFTVNSEPIYPTIWRTNELQDAAEGDRYQLEALRGYVMNPNSSRVPDEGRGPYLPIWQQCPAPHDPHAILFNLFNHPVFRRVFVGMNETLSPVLSEVTDLEFFYGGAIREEVNRPYSFLLQPVFQDFNNTNRDSSHIMGVVIALLPWDHYYEKILPPEARGIVVVMRDTCGDELSYQVNGAEAVFLGFGDFHDPAYDHLVQVSPFDPFERLNFSIAHNHCEYDLHIYPSSELEDVYTTNQPVLYAFLVMAVFFITALVFTAYDIMVQRRQAKVSLAAKKSKSKQILMLVHGRE